MIWVYAICDRPELPLPRVRGLGRAPLSAITEGPLVAVISRHVEDPDEPARDALWTHEQVVEALMAERAVLPIRFGTRPADVEAVRNALFSRRDVLLAELDKVRGRVELGVRVMQLDAALHEAASGEEYVLTRLAGSRTADALHEPLAALAVEARRWPERAPDELLRAAYLVDELRVGRFREAVEELQGDHHEALLLCTGPWPVYSFVGGVTA